MVSPLTFFGSDPNRSKNVNRGRGYYYKRNSYKKGWFSQYTGEADSVRKIKGKSQPKLSRKYQHAGDTTKRKRINHRVQISPRKQRRMKGWF